MVNHRKIYKKVKDLPLWEQNKVARRIKPYAGRAARKSLGAVRRVNSYKQRGVNKLRYVNSAGRRIQKARGYTDRKSWLAAKKEYEKLLSTKQRRELRIEFKNEAELQLSLINRILNVDGYKEQIRAYQQAINKKKPRIAVFTAISGGYDTVKLPEVLNPAFDYFLFTDTPAYDSGIFKIRPLPFYQEDPTRRARYVKTHPHQLLQGYDYAIWIDANIMTVADIMPMFEKFKASRKPIGAIRHPLRDSIYEETAECIKRGKENPRHIEEQEAHYRELEFDCTDLIESNVMMIDLKNKKVPGFYTTWWAEIDRYTRRDQLSINYAIYKNNIEWHRIIDRPYSARSHDDFVLIPHHVRQTSLYELERLLNKSKTDPNARGKSFFDIRDDVLNSKLIKDKKIDIVYCVHNALDDVRLCLESVVRHHHKNENLIIVDDGSDSDTEAYLKDFAQKHKSWTKLLRNPKGSGYTKAANQGIKASKTADFVILLNSDTIVTRDWSRKMAYAAFSTPGGGIVGPLSSAASHQSIPSIKSSSNQTAINEIPSGLNPDIINDHCEQWSPAEPYVYTALVHGFCFGITREVLNTIGLFDDINFATGYGEENDYCFRAIDAGFVLIVTTNTYVYHAKSKSYPSEKRIKYMKAGNMRLRELRGQERIHRTIVSVQQNPYLEYIRKKSATLYERVEKEESKKREHLRKILKDFYGFDSNKQKDGIKVDLVLQKGDTRPTSSAFIRLISPLTHPEIRDRIALRIFDGSKYTPREDTEVCIVQRTAIETSEKAQILLNRLDEKKIKLIVDVDDSFGDLSPSHPDYATQINRISALELLIPAANLLLTPSKVLAARYPQTKSVIIANHLDLRIWRLRPAKIKTNQPLRMVYMGTSTHSEDFKLVLPALDKLAEKYPGKFNLTVIGVEENPVKRDWITNLTPQIPSTIYPEFIHWFQKQGPFDIGLAPLQDTLFNRAKSDIKLLDYLACGIKPVASSLSPYTQSDLESFVKLCKTPQHWVDELELLIAKGMPSNKRDATKFIEESRTINKPVREIADLLLP